MASATRKNKNNGKRTPDQIKKDRVTIARLALQKKTQAQIAEIISSQYDFDITQQQVSFDLKAIRKEWRLESIESIEEAKIEAREELNLMMAETWEAWEKSKENRKVISRKQVAGDGEVTTRIETQVGNPAYMNLLRAQWESRCKIMGIESSIRYDDLDAAIAKTVRSGYEVKGTPEMDLEEAIAKVVSSGLIVQQPAIDVASEKVEEGGSIDLE